ncbi:aspartate dehydrogenase [Methanobacterium paludis]|uniref:L-aspartate dehydrogenase n=1 Tax=Methanobacterium paludis (strain DSM 25820 / JCM 18151 / SWAN1) TaxID=868131 RepID=F6D6S5_METPW|nr:aspartate dehydrogenase [Methanobacterium paludis]AEG18963.1 L-aspartate dehydrogenase [Methanobacterium paludis]
MKVGILGCGAIANIITNFAAEGKLGVDLNFFYDRDIERAENLASQVDGTVLLSIEDMLDKVDLVIEAASPQAVREVVPTVIGAGVDMIVMSVGALLDNELRERLDKLAKENNAKIYAPSGAIVGIDGIKAASIGKIQSASLVTRKPPRSLGISTDEEKILYEGKAGDAVLKFPMNINVAATLSLACGMEVDVKIIADPAVDRNMHEVHVIGEFGEFKTITENLRCSMNPKTSVLAAYSAIKLLKSLNETIHIGT